MLNDWHYGYEGAADAALAGLAELRKAQAAEESPDG